MSAVGIALRSVEKLTSIASGNAREKSKRLAQLIVLRNLRPQAPFDPDIFRLVLECADRGNELEMLYEKSSADAPEPRTVQPRFIIGTPLGWYMLVDDQTLPGKLRTFALARIKQARRTATYFEELAVDLEEHFRHHIGIYSGGIPERVRVIFERTAGRIAMELPPHATCLFRELPDGRIEMTMDVAIDRELEGWIAKWSHEAEVMEPASLREKFQLGARRMAEKYEVN